MASKTKKKTKEPSQGEMNNNLRKAKALEKIVEHNRDFLKLDITLPLGNPALKQVHTNQWLWTALPKKQFDLVNWGIIAKALNSNVNRYEGYVKNRWYIESNDITVDVAGNKAEMKLGVNAFASTFNSYSEAYRGMAKAYTDATTQKTSKTSASKSNSNAVTTGNNTTIKNGWWGSWVTELVKKTVGNETDTLKKCKKMHELFRWHVYYSKYDNMPKTGGSVKNLERVWQGKPYLNCGDGANFLSAFYACCGADTGIYLTYDSAHYIVRCTINGHDYWCDQSGGEGAHNTLRGFNQTWNGYRSGNYYGRYV